MASLGHNELILYIDGLVEDSSIFSAIACVTNMVFFFT